MKKAFSTDGRDGGLAVRSRLVCGCLAGVLAVGLCAPALAAGKDAAALMDEASRYEQAGDKLKAAEAYEALAQVDATRKTVIAWRLARLYAEAGVTNKALSWAREVMKSNPEPQAYLAGVHTLLKDYAGAETILRKELAGRSTNALPTQRLTLHWQLADMYDKKGDAAKADAELQNAVHAVKGTPDEPVAQRRLDAFREKTKKKEEGLKTRD